ncbi:MFS transporter [Nocardioides sp. zg-ZUI104]|uniref:MFS transporter n=1 Tax=Nocardioides faecalis TaxID=2803858 RepID=UPI001BCFDE68|nr:MFS transporter [Nocardioides faecalis]MBS4751889.1 MFS transporter [Nocardioides faecalis]
MVRPAAATRRHRCAARPRPGDPVAIGLQAVPDPAAAPRRRGVLLALAVLLVALNLRLAITSLGAMLDPLREQGLSATTAGVLTSLPVLCFAGVGATAMVLTRRVGVDRGLAVSLVLLTGGLVLRVVGGTPALVAGTLVACAGIAFANVLVPAIVKEHFPTRVGPVTGAYTAALALGSAAGAALTVPLANATGHWQVGLGAWAVVALAAALAWVPYCWRRSRAHDTRGDLALWRNPTAWAVTVLFGTQSVFAYVMMSWLPSVYAAAGFSDETAGLLLAVSIMIGVPLFFVAPSIAGRLRHQGHLVAGLTALSMAGWAGLWLAPAGGAWVWAALLGAGGAVFPVVLSFFAMRTTTVAGAAALSTMAQSIGYLLAAAGPFLVGVLHDVSDTWSLPCALLVALGLAQVAAGYLAGRDVVVDRA